MCISTKITSGYSCPGPQYRANNYNKCIQSSSFLYWKEKKLTWNANNLAIICISMYVNIVTREHGDTVISNSIFFLGDFNLDMKYAFHKMLPDRLIFTVAPSQTDHAGDYWKKLSSLNCCKLKTYLHFAIILDCNHIPNLLKDVNYVWKDYVTLDNWLKCRLHIDFNQLSPTCC